MARSARPCCSTPTSAGDRTSTMIRIGLVGCGHIGTVHSYAIKQLVDAGLVDAALTATYDTDPGRAARVAAHHDARPAASLAELVDAVDAVWVCTWTAAHLEAVSAAADAGRAVFCEKPLAPTLEACERVAAALERVPHQVGLVLRHTPVFTRAAALIGSGRYGRPLATTLPRRPVLPDPGAVRVDLAQGCRRGRGWHAHRALDPRRRHPPLVARRSRHRRGQHRQPLRLRGHRRQSWR